MIKGIQTEQDDASFIHSKTSIPTFPWFFICGRMGRFG
jgi:hypothetical protein